MVRAPGTQLPTIFLYETYPGGVVSIVAKRNEVMFESILNLKQQ